jgi:CRISPR-associated protein Csd1
MIVDRLAAFHQRIAPATPGFVRERVGYVVVIDTTGQLLTIRALAPEQKGQVMDVPKGPVRTVKPAAYFLVDNPAYVLGAAMDPADAKPAKRVDAARRLVKADEYFPLFRTKWLNEFVPAAADIESPVIDAVTRFLSQHNPIAFRARGMAGTAKNERFFESWITLSVAMPDGEEILLLEDDDICCLTSRLLTGDLAATEPDTCCVTGELGPVARTHYKLKGVPLSLSGQSSLISHNEASFQPYGLSDGAGALAAPVSVAAMIAYTGALNHMLGSEGRARHRQDVGDTAFLFWGAEDCLNQVREVINAPDAAEMARSSKKAKDAARFAAQTFASPFTGRPEERDAEVNLLGLTAAQARASIAYWCSGSVGTIADNIRAWVADIAFGAGHPWGHELDLGPWRPTIGRLTRLLSSQGAAGEPGRKEAKGEAATRARGRIARSLASCAFEDVPVPADLSHQAARLVIHGKFPGGTRNSDLATLIGLLGAYELRRRHISVENLMQDNMYNLGRYYTLIEKMEVDSLRARGAATVVAPVTRIKKAIYTRPRWGFEQLDDRFQVALRRLRPGSQVYYQQLRRTLLGNLLAERFPTSSSDSNLFLIGAHHEASALWAKRSAAANTDADIENDGEPNIDADAGTYADTIA